MMDQEENNEERSARSRVGLISHYPDRWCIMPILCRVTGSSAVVRSWPLLCPGKNSNLPGSRNEEEEEEEEKKMEKDGEKKRWRGEVAEKEENVTRRLEELSFEVAAGSFTFRNEIVLLLSLSLSSDRSFSLFFSPLFLYLLCITILLVAY